MLTMKLFKENWTADHIMNKKFCKILMILEQDDYVTADQIARELKVTDRTVRTYIKNMQSQLPEHVLRIDSRPNLGYRLMISDHNAFLQWKEMLNLPNHSVPSGLEERFLYLLRLLMDKDFHKTEAIADVLYISSKVISADLGRVEEFISEFDLHLERRPGYGIRITGKEFDFRRCIIEGLIYSDTVLMEKAESSAASRTIAAVAMEILERYDIHLSEAGIESLILYLYVTCKRQRNGFFILPHAMDMSFAKDVFSFKAAADMMEKLRRTNELAQVDDFEVFYASVYIISLQDHARDQESLGLVIPSLVLAKVKIVLDEIHMAYGVDFQENLSLYVLLANHMLLFHIRMTYGIPLANPLAEEICQKYAYACAMAQRGLAPLAAAYGREISKAEMACFAVLLEMGLEMIHEQPRKRNVLLVTGAKQTGNRLLVYQLRQAFGNYLDVLETAGTADLEHMDLKKYDYIFSTVRPTRRLPLPILCIGSFLENADYFRVKQALEMGDPSFLNRYFKNELFFTGLQAKTKEEAIFNLCQLAEKVRPLPEGLYASVLEREAMGSTDFGNKVAMPHPARTLDEEDLVIVGILKKPIVWQSNEVTIFILSHISDSASAQAQNFYKITAEFLSDPAKVQYVLKHQTCQALLYALQNKV